MRTFLFLIALMAVVSCKDTVNNEDKTVQNAESIVPDSQNPLIMEGENHFKDIQQVTFGGDNAEAYWSFDDKQLVFQSNNTAWDVECDQMFLMNNGDSFRESAPKMISTGKGRTTCAYFLPDNAEAYWSFDDKQLVFQSNNTAWDVECDQMFLMNNGDSFRESAPKMVSTGKGRTTCAYFLPDNEHIIYASTHLAMDDCPDTPLKENGKYVWPIYDSYDIFVADLDGNITAQLTDEKGYDAEPTVSPQGDKIVFTSDRSGDLELYTMNIDGSDVKQITYELGYDGGAFFSPDGSQLIFRSSRPKTEAEIKEYKDLLKVGLVQPTEMELYICNADGSDLRQLTQLGNANWSPFFLPDGKRVLFSSNFEAERGFPFNLYMINTDGTGLERITHGETFDAFPVFSNNGKYLAFSSNRNNGGGRDTNLFIAEWQD